MMDLPNMASFSTDNVVTWDVTPPTVTINKAAGQADPTSTSPIDFTVVFSEPADRLCYRRCGTLSGTAGATTATVTGSGTTYNVAVSGMTTSGHGHRYSSAEWQRTQPVTNRTPPPPPPTTPWNMT